MRKSSLYFGFIFCRQCADIVQMSLTKYQKLHEHCFVSLCSYLMRSCLQKKNLVTSLSNFKNTVADLLFSDNI